MPELIARGLTEPGPLLEEMRAEADRVLRDLLGQNIREIKRCRSTYTTQLGS